ncbi:transglycosylase SLT domain-containing protein [Novosphingobium gossypii]|uniref:transglycosylase SLT domain-containing protein n=1 Tax=Novosphingobium gossypii TaxID=1604774 RepID=UPI003D1B5C97
MAAPCLPVRAEVPEVGPDVARWEPIVDAASQRFGVPASWIEQVIDAESRGRTEVDGRPIRSIKGAMGLMQLMPGTWAELRRRLGLGDDPDHPYDNIMAGTYYLGWLHDRYGYPGLFAAYNAGPGRYEKYLAGTPLPAETQAYLARIAGGLGGASASMPPAADDPSRSMLFVTSRPQPVDAVRVDAGRSGGPGMLVAPDRQRAQSVLGSVGRSVPSDPWRGDAVRGDPMRGDPMRGDPMRGDPMRGDPMRGDPMRDRAKGVEPVRRVDPLFAVRQGGGPDGAP